MLAPFMPFLADFIYKDITSRESVHLEPWSNLANLTVNPEVTAKMEIVREIVSLGLSVRKEKSLPVRQPLAALAYDFNDAKMALPQEYHALVLAELNVKKFDANLLDKDLRPEGAVTVAGASVIKNFYFDLNLNEELRQEGAARELERAVQDLRKKSGLKVGDLVDLYYNT